MLALQITENMELVDQQINSYLKIYNSIDSTYVCVHEGVLADTLEKVDDEVLDTLLLYSLSEYTQLEVDNRLDAYKLEILNTIGDVDLISHIDAFYILAQQYVNASSKVIEQKRKVTDTIFTNFDIKKPSIDKREVVRFLHELPEFNVFYFRMLNVRSILEEIEKSMQTELDNCKKILNIEKTDS